MDPLIDEANHVDFITLLDAVFADLHNPAASLKSSTEPVLF